MGGLGGVGGVHFGDGGGGLAMDCGAIGFGKIGVLAGGGREAGCVILCSFLQMLRQKGNSSTRNC